MKLCLNECLRAVGLQHHYARFTSLGVRCAAHLSALTMEDYPILGIRTMEERTRLFSLVQMVRTLDLEYEYEDGDNNGADFGARGLAVVDNRFAGNGYVSPNEDIHDDDRPSQVRRRLDFSRETTDHRQKLLLYPTDTVQVHTGQNGNDMSVHVQQSAAPVSAVVCGCIGNSNHRAIQNSAPANHRWEADTKPHFKGGFTMHNSDTSSSPKYVLLHQQQPRLDTAPSKRHKSKKIGHKNKKGTSTKENVYPEISRTATSVCTAMPKLIYDSKKTAGYNYGLPRCSNVVPNKKRLHGERRIRVCVRKRPLTCAESRGGDADVVTTLVGECVIVHETKEAVDLTQYILQHKFYFDQVFGEDSSNEEVYQSTAYPLVQHMLRGGKATCFAYGQTGAGKTHTMLGSSTRTPGLYALAVRDIFAHLSTSHMHTLVYVSFFEIYCGQLYDLLDHKKRVFAREDGQKVVHIAGLRNIRVDSVGSLLEVISRGTEERTQGTSGVNPLSSRSHALLKIQLRDPNEQTVGRIWFVDLAGSERASDTKDPDRRSRMEGAEINQSLLALKECIRSLDQEQLHTPFRQSKLTQVLKDSFVGDSMTCMIANISPGYLSTEHTLNTLRYADRVKELTGQGCQRGGRREKKMSSTKHNLSNSNSSSVSSINSVGMRGKSPSKKQKLGSIREAFSPTAPNTRMSTNFCSTPKNSTWGAETSAMGRKEIEHITPIKGWVGTGDSRQEREETGGRSGRKGDNEKDKIINNLPGIDQNARTAQVLGQKREEQLPLWYLPQGETGTYHEEMENRQLTVKQRKEEESGCLEAEKLKERNLHKADERNMDKQRHLRWYHQQLQQFGGISSVSSSVNLCSTSTCPSLSVALCSSSSPSVSSPQQHDSSLTLSGLEEVRADVDQGQLSFPSQEANERGAVFQQGWDERDNRRSEVEAGEIKLNRPTGREGGEKKWAWFARGDTVTGATAANVAAQVSDSCHSEDQGDEGVEGSLPTNATADAGWSGEGNAGHLHLEPPHRRAPAERPLSPPACERTITLLNPKTRSWNHSLKSKHSRSVCNTLPQPLQNASIPDTTITQPDKPAYNTPSERHYHPVFKSDMSVLRQNETKVDSLSYDTEPLSISMLQVDQQVATASFLQGEQINPSLRGEDVKREADREMLEKVVGDEVGEIAPSFLELPKIRCRLMHEPMSDINHSDGGKDVCSVTHKHCQIGWTRPPVLEVKTTSLQKLDNCQKLQNTPVHDRKASASLLTPSASISTSAQRSSNTDVSSLNLNPNGATQRQTHHLLDNTYSLISAPQSVLNQNHTVSLSYSSDSNKSLKLNSQALVNSQESCGNQAMRPTICLSTMEDLDHAQCCVIKAHWQQLEEMETLFQKEGTLLCQQPDMTFGDYVQKLEEIMEQKARCIHDMRMHLQPYLKHNQSD